MPIPITHAIRAPIMITCGQLRCILATSAACRAILGMGRHRKGERGRGRVGFRPRSSPPCFIPLPMVIFHPLPLPCGPSPGEDHFVFDSSLLCFFASAAHLATGFRSAVFPYSAIFPEWAFLLYFYFFPGSLYFSARYFRLFGGSYNLQLMSGGAFFFLDVREARKGLL